MTTYTVDVLMALEEGEELTPDWWANRYARANLRAGGMPPEVADPGQAELWEETDPESGERYARVTIPLQADIPLGRARELSHLLTSIFIGEGFTLRRDGERQEELPGEHTGDLTAEFGAPAYTESRVFAHRCLSCIFSCDSRIGCCTQGSAFSLADIGAALLAGADEHVARVLALPGEMDGVKWHPHMAKGRCVFHDRSTGCTLPREQMPLQCRTYLCLPEQLLPPAQLAEYEGYVDRLEEQEFFVEEHMREQSGVDFDSPLDEIREAARKAFAAWEKRTAG